MLHPHDLRHDLLGTGLIEFDYEYPLPGTQLEFLSHHIEECRGRETDRLIVRVPVDVLIRRHVFGTDFEIIVQIFVRPRSKLLKQYFHILDKQRFRLIYDDCDRRMETLNIDDSVLDTGSLDLPLNLVGDVDEIERRTRRKLDDMIHDTHMTGMY